MSTDLMIPEGSIPAYILALAGGNAAAENEAALGGVAAGMPPRIKLSGKQFMLVDAGGDEIAYPPAKLVPGPDGNLYLPVIVLKAKRALSKAWYLEAYNPNAAEFKAPDCASTDGERPDAGVFAPQSDVCATCPQNAFGSGRDQNGNPTKGKACTDNKILAVYVPGYGIYMLKMPPASLKGFGSFVKKLSASNIPLTTVKTFVGFEVSETYPVLTFQFGGFIPEASLPKLAEMAESPEVKDIIGPVPGESSAPAQKALPDTAALLAAEVKRKEAEQTKAANDKAAAEKAAKKAAAEAVERAKKETAKINAAKQATVVDDLDLGLGDAPEQLVVEKPQHHSVTASVGASDDELAAALGL